MSDKRVLIIDDEEPIRNFLRIALSGQSYEISEAASGKDGLAVARTKHPDIIILDLGLPDIDRIEIIHATQGMKQTPIIILSVRGLKMIKSWLWTLGLMTTLTKPFSIPELLARLRVALRRADRPTNETIFIIGDLKVDVDKRLVTLGSRKIQLTPHEYGILKTLVMHSGKVITHRQLMNEVWGYGLEQEFHILHVNISNLRRKLKLDPNHPKYITTESGVGYRMNSNLETSII